jgi:hypothetical protein
MHPGSRGYTFFIMSLVFIATVQAFAGSEPNDSPLQAIFLSVNTSDSGYLGPRDFVDWWVVNVPEDGNLFIETVSDSSLEVDLKMYDMYGEHEIASYDIGWGVRETTHKNGLSPGMYFIEATRYSGTGHYKIFSTYVTAALPGDPEPDDSLASAVPLMLNSEGTGHLGYSYNLQTDEVDWWSMTTTSAEGTLFVTVQTDTSLGVDLRLFDRTAPVEIDRIACQTVNRMHASSWGVAPGTYYLQARRQSGSGCYTISASLFPAKMAGDREPNDLPSQAQILQAPGRATGHLGYFSRASCDLCDWWKVTTPGDGQFTVRALCDSTAMIGLAVYDTLTEDPMMVSDTMPGVPAFVRYDRLISGTYYVKVLRKSGFGCYDIYCDFAPARGRNDAEPDNGLTTAARAELTTIESGHLGYSGRGYTDKVDYYAFDLPEAWDTLLISLQSEQGMDADLYLHDSSGVEIASATKPGRADLLAWPDAASGRYYLRVELYRGAGSYNFMIREGVRSDTVHHVDPVPNLPFEYVLHQNYPNPFNAGTVVRYELPFPSIVSLRLYSLDGQEVAELAGGEAPAGIQEYHFDAGNLASGVYLLIMRAEALPSTLNKTFTGFRKLVLTK